MDSKFKQKKNLIFATIIQILFILSTVATVCIYFYIEPFPEKSVFDQLDADMIANGELTSLALIYSFVGLTVILAIVNLIFIIITCYRIFAVKLLEDLQNNYKKSFAWAIVKTFIFAIFYTLFGIFLLPYLWYLYYKDEIGYYVICVSKHLHKNSAKKSATLLVTSILGSVMTLSSLGVAFTFLPLKTGNQLMSKESVTKATTLSNNHPNVIQFYFDRAQGVAWNMILQIDFLLNGQDSFIYNFPEFTSYLNTITLSSITKCSNPVIYSGAYYAAYVKEFGKTNTFSTTPNNQLSLNDWYFNALKNECEMYMEQGIKNISICNAPFFGSYPDFNTHDSSCGNMYLLQKKFNEAGMNNVSTTTNAKIAEVKGNFNLSALDNPFRNNEYVMYNLPHWLKCLNTGSGSFLQFFSQQTHETYVYRDANGKVVSSADQETFFASMYTALKEVQKTLMRLKSEPYYNNFGTSIGSVYDYTLIYIISDHGFSFTKDLSTYKDMLDYLSSQNLITPEQILSLLNFDNYVYNPVMMIKPFKYNYRGEVIHNQTAFDFNVDQIVTLADLQRIVEIYLNEYNGTNTTSRIVNTDLLNKIENQGIKDILIGETLLYPLSTEFNSIQAKKFTNRQVYYAFPSSWRFRGNQKSFQIIRMGYFKMNPANTSIFNNNNFQRFNINK